MSQPAVTTQPGAPGGWMQKPASAGSCPPGLEYLMNLDQVLCHQIVELLEAFTGWETNNKYVMKNSMGQQIFYVFEDTDLCMRICCNANRGFVLKIVDNTNREVMRIERPFKCCAGCCWCASACDCCSHEVTVEAPPGNVIGTVRQTADGCNYNYAVQDANGNTNLVIKGPFLMCACCSDVEFPVYTPDGTTQIGAITKQWTGLAREMFTDADNFGITFPIDLDVRVKATLFGALFLIDFMAFEKKNNNNN